MKDLKLIVWIPKFESVMNITFLKINNNKKIQLSIYMFWTEDLHEFGLMVLEGRGQRHQATWNVLFGSF